mgnify:CR=1 FL=1
MKKVPFSAEEALKIAIKIEEQGEEFYREMRSFTEDEELEELFDDLAEEKNRFREKFEGMLGESRLEKGEDINSLLYGQLEDTYLAALGESKVFTQKNMNVQAAKVAHNRNELISVALSLEKDAILYFYEILDKADSEEDSEVIEDIIEEEKDQIRRLILLR